MRNVVLCWKKNCESLSIATLSKQSFEGRLLLLSDLGVAGLGGMYCLVGG